MVQTCTGRAAFFLLLVLDEADGDVVVAFAAEAGEAEVAEAARGAGFLVSLSFLVLTLRLSDGVAGVAGAVAAEHDACADAEVALVAEGVDGVAGTT